MNNLFAGSESYDAITARNARTSPLLRLPPELRNKIYVSVFTEGIYPLCGHHNSIHNLKLTPVIEWKVPPRWLGLLQTCRQIHSEANLLPYTLNTFSAFEVSYFDSQFEKMKTYDKIPTTLQLLWKHSFAWKAGGARSRLTDLLPSVQKVVLYLEPDYHGRLFRTLVRAGGPDEEAQEGSDFIRTRALSWLGVDEHEGVEVEFVEIKDRMSFVN